MKETRKVILANGLLSAFVFCASALGQRTLPTTLLLSNLPLDSVDSAEGRASWVQQAKLTASDGQQYDSFGASSATNGDAVVIGMDSGQRSEAYVFVKPSNGWGDMTETAKLTASDGPIGGFGYSVGISGDTVIVGAPGANGVYVYVKPATGWADMTETAKLTASGYNGEEVVISGDAVVSGSSLTGEDYLFVKPPGGWKTTTNPTTTLHPPGSGYRCGLCVGINGKTIAVGVPSNFLNEGTVYVFVKPMSGWPKDLNPTATLIASDAALDDNFGFSVSVNSNTIVAGAPYHANVGAIYVFEKPAGGWTSIAQTAEVAARDGSATGTAVGLSANGKTIVAGSPFARVGTNQGQGAAYTFTKPKNGWKTTKEFNAELTASDGSQNDVLGTSIGVSGATIIVGAPAAMVNGNHGQGAEYVFVK